MAEHCYVLTLPNGALVEDHENGEAHFPNEATARERAPQFGDAAREATPTRLDEPCVTLTCQGCDFTFDEDEGYFFHFESREDALRSAKDFGWTIRDGEPFCTECPPAEAAPGCPLCWDGSP
jgi:hypothetical protein